MAAPEDPIKNDAGFAEWMKLERQWNPRLGDNWRFKERIATTDTAIIAHFVYDEEEGKKDRKNFYEQKEMKIKKAEEEREEKERKKAEKAAKEKAEENKKGKKKEQGEEKKEKKQEEKKKKKKKKKEEYYGAPHTDNVVLKIKYRRPNDKGNRPNGYPENYDGDRHEWQFLYTLTGFFPSDNYPAKNRIPRRPQNIVRHFRSQWVRPPDAQGVYSMAFLEYCPGVEWKGKTHHNLDVFDRDDSGFIHELDIWLIFRQFTRMILMLDCGHEIQTGEGSFGVNRLVEWETTEICHYDIEPRNILIGYKNNETDRVPMLKLCDFGDALNVPYFRGQQEFGRYRFPNITNGRMGYRAPEATLAPSEFVHPFRHGSCSNIFQFANIIRLLMHGNQSSELDMHPAREGWVVKNLGDYSTKSPATYARSLIYGDHKMPPGRYSSYLIDLVIKCMYEKPALRPDPEALWYLVRDGYKKCFKEVESDRRKAPEESDESIEDDAEAEKDKEEARKKKAEEPSPPLNPIFQQAQVAPEGFRQPMPEWMEDFSDRVENFSLPRTPRCPTPEYKTGEELIQREVYVGDDLPFNDRDKYPASRPQVPPRLPHGFPIVDERPSVNIPEQYPHAPGSIARNCELLRYYDRLGQMWMGEEKYWKMLEAGLDPQTYNWGMRIPDPEMDLDVGPMSGSEGDREGDSDESEVEHQVGSPKATINFSEEAGCPEGV